MQRVSLLRSFLLFFWFFSVFLFSRLLERLFLLAEEIIVAALAEVAVACAVGIIVKYNIPTPVALNALFFVALFAYKNTTIFAYLIGFFFGQFFAADFTFDCFHRALLLAFLS